MFRSLSHLLSFLSQQYWFWVVDSAGHREPFRHLLLGYPPKHTEVNHHTERGSDPSVRECYFLICFFSFTSLQFLISLSSSRLRSRTVIDYDRGESSRLWSSKVLDYDREKSSRLRSRKSSRLRSITVLNYDLVLDHDREKVLNYDREKFSTTIEKQFSTTIEQSSRLRSRKSSRLRSSKSSRLRSRKVLDYDR